MVVNGPVPWSKINNQLKEEIKRIDNSELKHGWEERDWSSLDENSKHYDFYLILSEGNDLHGFALTYSAVIDFSHLLKIVTKNKLRNDGLGSKLLTAVISQSISDKVEKIYLEVSVDNTPAIGLYKKYQFEEIIIKKRFYSSGEDAIAMQLKIK